MNAEDAIQDVRGRYQSVAQPLNELQRRHWAAQEALRLGRGGITIVSQALHISPNTVRRGIREISAGQPDARPRAITRVRKPGGGRKSKPTNSESHPHGESSTTLPSAEVDPRESHNSESD